MRLSALQRANAAKNSGKARKQGAAKRDAAEREMDWDAAILRLKAMLDRISPEGPCPATTHTDVPDAEEIPPEATTAPGKGL